MAGLGWVRRGYVGNVLDDDVRLVKVPSEAFIVRFDLLDPSLVGLEYTGTLHLVENRVMRRVDFIPSIDIGRQQPLGMACGKCFNFMSGSVSSEHAVLVDIVTVCNGPARMIGGKAEGVKVLGSGDHGVKRR